VVGAGADDGEADGHVHAAVEVEQLHRDEALVVVHGDDEVVVALHGFDKDGVGGEGADGIDAVLAGHEDGGLDDAFFLIAEVLLRLVGLFLGMATTRISLDLYDTGEADLSKLGDLVPQFGRYLLGKIIYGVIVLIGLVLLIVPGIILSYMFLYVGYLIIDRDLGPIEALKESKVVTDGSKLSLLLFSLVVALLNIAGVLCLLVGLLVTIPVTLMASVYVYRQLSPRLDAPAA